MRKNIALLLALVMILSLIPMTAFAATANRVTNVVQAEEDKPLAADSFLVIRNDRDDLDDDMNVIRLSLENAEWKSQGALTGYVYSDIPGAIAIERLSSSRIQVEFVDGGLGPNGDETRFPLHLMISKIKEVGDARITIDPLDSAVTGGTYTFATGVKGDTTASIASVRTFGPEEVGFELNNIIIDENTAGALDLVDAIELTLNRDFEFVAGSFFTVRGTGGFEGSHVLEVLKTGRDLKFIPATGISPDDSAVYDSGTGISRVPGSSIRGSIILQGVEVYSDSTRFGDVNMTFDGSVTRQTLKVANYADYAMVVEADGDLEEIIAGRFDDAEEGEGFALTTMTFEEKIEDSIVASRNVTVEFPSWVLITAYEIDGDLIASDVDDNEFTFVPADYDDGKIELEIDIEVTLRADAPHGEDIVATVSGRGLDQDYEVALGVVVQPITVEMELSEIVIGESSQAIADIVITENVEGAIMEEDLVVVFDIPGIRIQSGLEVEADDDSGLEIDDFEVVHDWFEFGSAIVITIDRDSDEAPAVITISNVLVSMNRIPATGDYDVMVGGEALVNNNLYEDDWFWEEDYVFEAPLLRVVTERSVDAVAGEIAFTIGMNAYTVDGEMMAMDVAPFIMNDRTMVPVRYLEELFGMQPIWNATSRTVTVLYNGMVYEMAIGSNMLKVNGAPYMELDATVMIQSDRTFVPASRFARAMGIDYTWDPATQTATFMK